MPAAIDLVRSFYAAYAAGDLTTRQNLLDPAFELIPLDGSLVHGRHGLQRALEDMADQFRTYDVHASRFVPVDDTTVVVALSRSALTHHSDVPVTDHFAQLFSLRNGLIAKVQSFHTVDEALASLGAQQREPR